LIFCIAVLHNSDAGLHRRAGNGNFCIHLREKGLHTIDFVYQIVRPTF
jgi:hypothetical protein